MSGRRHDGFVPGRHPIEAYGAGGFRFAGMSHKGSILALPTGIHRFAPASLADITLDSLAPLFEEAEPAGFLIIGTGADIAFVPRDLREALKARGVVVEGMATAAAARTYNVLVAESRHVAAALIAVG
jgi:uncharacterized protein